ncbi:MAG: sigma-54 dependent transcriptional regulator, partial [Desulfobacterales bacterium]|nr:sigma-54 dependent transcriptional regulator [Desulfobacterales bacterium]
MTRILVVDDKQMMRDSVTTTLSRAGFQPIAAPDGPTALELIERHRPAAMVTDLKMPGMDGLSLLRHALEREPNLPIILMTAYASVETAVQAMKDGAFDYIQKPFDGDELVVAVKRAAEHYRLKRENEALRCNNEPGRHTQLIGESGPMRELRSQIDQIADSHSTVLITGESGTGKEVVARRIVALSPRKESVLLAVNCAALSTSLLESELFGHEKGAFTGAEQLRKGRFELSDGGTLILDEISEVDPAVQAKLLRVLQEQQIERVGSSYTMEVDVRVIATSNRALDREVAEGRFREDLLFRLNVLPIRVPALCERGEDISMLADHFLMSQALRDGRDPKGFDDAATNLLMEYEWPGNVRELQNICERAGVLTAGNTITADHIAPWLAGQ